MLLQSLLRPVLTPLMRGMFDAPIASSAAWSPLALWPDGIDSPGMWMSPRTLTSQWQDSAGTTPVVEPGTVADASNPVGLALDIRAGAPEVLGPEVVINGDFATNVDGWTATEGSVLTWDAGRAKSVVSSYNQGINQSCLTVGKTYEATCTFTNGAAATRNLALKLGSSEVVTSIFSGETKTLLARDLCRDSAVLSCRPSGVDPQNGDVFYYSNISVKEIPGLHMLQSTSAARPLMSARVNLLDYTNNFSHNAVTSGITLSSAVTTGPFGGSDGWKFTEESSNGFHYTRSNTLYSFPAGQVLKRTGYFKQGSVGRNVQFGLTYGGDSFGGVIDLSSGTLVAGSTGAGTTISSTVTLVNGWYECTVTGTMGVSLTGAHPYEAMTNSTTYQYTCGPSYLGDGTSFVYAFGRDLRAASVASSIPPYQSVPGNGSTYATDFPIFQKYDGVDDGMATATFAAGTLTSAMDCMIAVRRDSDAATYLISDTGSRGFFEWESGDTDRPDVGAGMPTYYVDGVACTATRGALFTALTAGDWHILEARGLDLSTWLKVEVSSLVSYRLNGPRGDILLYPSTTPTEDKDAARQWLADYYGVTLP